MTTTSTAAHTYDEADDRQSLAMPTAAFRAGLRADRYPVVPTAVTAALDARETLTELHRHLFDGVPRPAELTDGLLHALTTGQPAQDALDAAVDAHMDRERRNAAANLLRWASDGAEKHLRDTVRDALPEMLAGLRDQLEQSAEALRKAYRAAGDLDINQPDPLLVAQATKAQQDALVTIAEETRKYRRIRTAQRDALAASSLPVPGDNPWRSRWSWRDLFATGVHEVQHPGTYGLPGEGRAPRLAVQAVVTRADMWLPDPDQMADAYEQLQSVVTLEANQRSADDEPRASAAAAAAGPQPVTDVDRHNFAVLDAHSKNSR